MMKKFRGLCAINDVLDDRYKKLSDKYDALSLSHNRKKQLLKNIMQQLLDRKAGDDILRNKDGEAIVMVRIDPLIHDIENALYSDGRVYQKKDL